MEPRQQVERIVVAADLVDIVCYVGRKAEIKSALAQIYRETQTISEGSPHRQTKYMLLLINFPYQQLESFVTAALSLHNLEQHSINFVLMESRSKAYEYIEQIRKVNTDAEFETNYLQMQESAEEAISYGLVEQYATKKLMWKKSVIDNLLQQKKVLSIKDLLEYPNLSAWQRKITQRTLKLLEHSQKISGNP